MLLSAKKNMILGREGDKLKAASVLYAAAKLKEENKDITSASLSKAANEYMKKRSFIATVSTFEPREIESSIKCGNFEKTHVEVMEMIKQAAAQVEAKKKEAEMAKVKKKEAVKAEPKKTESKTSNTQVSTTAEKKVVNKSNDKKTKTK